MVLNWRRRRNSIIQNAHDSCINAQICQLFHIHMTIWSRVLMNAFSFLSYSPIIIWLLSTYSSLSCGFEEFLLSYNDFMWQKNGITKYNCFELVSLQLFQDKDNSLINMKYFQKLDKININSRRIYTGFPLYLFLNMPKIL